ncbi:hypothetical protein Vafri_21575 [Volvox africanus]|uniref:J domain-containing protein n=1 Tax=Volvox africanus TaxID=51714 RepID=A0A8J4BVX1_9CHLO|nr:hypothetical protein Vafri_21575 [Volvox africanus]
MCVSSKGAMASGPCHTDRVGTAPNLYEVLGVSMKATTEEIRLSYLKLARLWHPDRHANAEYAKRAFQSIQCAYEGKWCLCSDNVLGGRIASSPHSGIHNGTWFHYDLRSVI